ncbi:unnamed protein product [Ilex paraguariensis]|uniref:Uncharacterized protein n=1 Tax=Ilex paraguariensis TaxID=185542 RepID=A0ABC8TIT5_9AQUA
MLTGEELGDLGGEPGEIFVVPGEEEEELGVVVVPGASVVITARASMGLSVVGASIVGEPTVLVEGARSWVMKEALGSLGEHGALGADLGADLRSLGEQPARVGGKGRLVQATGEQGPWGSWGDWGCGGDGRATQMTWSGDGRLGSCQSNDEDNHCLREAVVTTGVGGRAKGGLGEAYLQVGVPPLALSPSVSLGKFPLAWNFSKSDLRSLGEQPARVVGKGRLVQAAGEQGAFGVLGRLGEQPAHVRGVVVMDGRLGFGRSNDERATYVIGEAAHGGFGRGVPVGWRASLGTGPISQFGQVPLGGRGWA